jgi:Cu-processing system permease protein
MKSPILTIAHLTFREAIRRKIVLAGLILGICFLIIYNIGFYFMAAEIYNETELTITRLMRSGVFNFLVLAGLYTVTFLAIAMASLVSADSLAGEISSGTIHSLVAKPIRRMDIALGKWLGIAFLLAAYVLLVAGGVVLSVWLQQGYMPSNVLTGIGLIYLESLLVMSLALLCSSRLSALATGGVVFGLYGLAVIGGWVEQIGAFLKSTTAVNVGIITSLIMPAEALWRRAAFVMQSPVTGSIVNSPFNSFSTPSPLMVAYAVVYLLVTIMTMLRLFSKRDL